MTVIDTYIVKHVESLQFYEEITDPLFIRLAHLNLHGAHVHEHKSVIKLWLGRNYHFIERHHTNYYVPCRGKGKPIKVVLKNLPYV